MKVEREPKADEGSCSKRAVVVKQIDAVAQRAVVKKQIDAVAQRTVVKKQIDAVEGMS